MIQPNTKYARILLKSGPITITGGGSWASLTGKPAEFKPEPHNHTFANITGLDDLASDFAFAQADISDLQSTDRVIQARAVALEHRVDNLEANASTALTLVHTSDVIGLDPWMATTDNAISAVRANLTGKASIGHTHASSDITDFATQMATKADKVHVHGMADVTGLTAALANVTAGNHTHPQSDITGLTACLTSLATDLTAASRAIDQKANTTRYATTAQAGLVKIGQNLSVTSDGTLSASAGADWANITGKPTVFTPEAHKHPTSDITGLDGTLTTTANSIATINAKIPTLADKVHTHAIDDVSGLNAQIGAFTACFTATDAELALKINEGIADVRYAGITHTHYIDDVTGLKSELDNLKTGVSGNAYTLPPATAFKLGGVKVGQNLSVDANGVLSAIDSYVLPNATASILGGVRVGNSLTVNNGTINVDPTVYIPQLVKGTANGVASLDALGKVPAAQISAIAISDTYVVADEAERLKQTAHVGDVAVQLDIQQTFILQSEPPTANGNWVQLLNNVACVTSVNGLTGNVELFGANITNNVWQINGLTGNVTLEGTDLANNVFSFNNRTGAVTLTGTDLPKANATTIGAVKPDGVSTFVDANGTLSAAGVAIATTTTLGVVKIGTGLNIGNDGTVTVTSGNYEDRIKALEKSLVAMKELFASTAPATPTTVKVTHLMINGGFGSSPYADMIVSPWQDRVDPLFLYNQEGRNSGPMMLVLRSNIDLGDNVSISAHSGNWIMWNSANINSITAMIGKTGKKLTAATQAEFDGYTKTNTHGQGTYTLDQIKQDFKYVYFVPNTGINHYWIGGGTWQRMFPTNETCHITFSRV